MRMGIVVLWVAAMVVPLALAAGCSEQTPPPKSPAKASAPAAPSAPAQNPAKDPAKSAATEPPKGAEGAPVVPVAEITQKFCPVNDEPIDRKISVTYKGRTVYFCCVACIAKFGADPEKYLKKLDEPASPPEVKPAAADAKPGDVAKVTYWCSMHHDVRSDTPGECPKCHMPLVPMPEEKKPAEAPPAGLK
jgi:YHS domain-containing protein